MKAYKIGKELINSSWYQNAQEASYKEKKKAPSRTEIINHLLSIYEGATRYLEIGVRNPDDNFAHISATEKYSVDPGVEFEANPVDFPVTSDAFFDALNKSEVLSSDIRFDVIFIDGLHTAEQVDRDVSNALKYTKENGFIVLHDCNPPTEWHARETFQFKQSPAGSRWNGTTWKAFLKWRHEQSLYSCCVDCDWGVGILSKAQDVGAPLDKINQNPFYEFAVLSNNRKDFLNLISFSELQAKLQHD